MGGGKMKEIVLATRNKHKIEEIRAILGDTGLKIFTLDDFQGCPETVEDGDTFQENAIKKARTVCSFTGKTALSDDSGLEVDVLNGSPGVISARFAGDGCSYKDNNIKLLELMKNVNKNMRGARFRCVAVLCKPDGELKTVEGTCKGDIALEERGEGGFGYDPLFIVPFYGKTFAELPVEIKNRISHRAIAFAKIKELICR